MRLPYPSQARLLHRSDFQRIYAQGECMRSPLLMLRHAPSSLGPTAPVRFGFTVSRQVARRAVDRNRIRRVFREACRQVRPRFRPGIDVVLNARRPMLEGVKTARVQATVIELAQQAGLLPEPLA
jgi:ribonuclease P protein component